MSELGLLGGERPCAVAAVEAKIAEVIAVDVVGQIRPGDRNGWTEGFRALDTDLRRKVDYFTISHRGIKVSLGLKKKRKNEFVAARKRSRLAWIGLPRRLEPETALRQTLLDALDS